MSKETKLQKEIRKHTQYWDCYNDCPLEYNHSGKVMKIIKNFSVSFTLFCAENFTHNSDSNYWWDSFWKEIHNRRII